MHLSDGEIRAYQDQELRDELHQQAQAHLEACPRCQARAAEQHSRSQRLSAQLSSLDPGPSQAQQSPVLARPRLARRLEHEDKEKITMWNKLTRSIPRPVWATLAIVAILAVALAFGPVRAVANSFLSLFRVEQIQVIEVDPSQLEEQFGSSSQLEQLLTQSAQFESRGDPQEVSSAEQASELTGVPVRLPAEIEGAQKITVQPGGDVKFNVDLELVRAVLRDIGRPDIQLPDSLDGAAVAVDIPDGVMAQYGPCEFKEGDEAQPGTDPDMPADETYNYECTTLMQMPSPTISAPPDLDVAQIGEAYLQVLGMSAEEAARFSQNVDWTTTFIIPIPRYGADYRDVQVDGVTGTLLLHHGREMYILMWVKNGILYALSGPGDANTALEIVSSLK